MTKAITKHIDDVLLQNKNKAAHNDITDLLSIFTRLQEGNETLEVKKEKIESFLAVKSEHSLTALIKRVQEVVSSKFTTMYGSGYSIDLLDRLQKFASGEEKTLVVPIRDMADVALALISDNFNDMQEKYYHTQTSIQLSDTLALQKRVSDVLANVDLYNAKRIVNRMHAYKPADHDHPIVRLIKRFDTIAQTRAYSKLHRALRNAASLIRSDANQEEMSGLFLEASEQLGKQHHDLGADENYREQFERGKEALIRIADTYKNQKAVSISRNLNPRQTHASKQMIAGLKESLLNALSDHQACARDLCIWIMQGKEEWSKLGGNHQSENPRTRLVSLLCHQQRALTELVKYPDSYYLVNDIAKGTHAVDDLGTEITKRSHKVA